MRRTSRVLVALLLLPTAAGAQHAIVLSGGGARGIAHAGALIALEELGYGAPLVVGTSMGAIIGALYAAGYTPAQIRSILADENWLARFAAEPIVIGPRREPERPLLNLGLGRARYHEGLVTGTGINLRLAQLFFDAGARARNDFDELPRRLRVVSTDFATGAEVVIAGGDLPRAVRASMAVPGAFAPVPWGDRMLMDGGVANNLPISVARREAALPVVAVDAVRPDADAPERNPIDIGVRGLRLLIRNAQPGDVEPDILVVPRIRPGFSEARFPADPTRLIRAGYEAVREQVPPAPGAPAAAPGPRAPRARPAFVVGVRVEVDDPALARLIHAVMLPATGAYDAELILRRIAALYDTGLFTALWPRLVYTGTGRPPELVINAVPVTRSSVALDAHWDNDVGGGFWTSLRHRVAAWAPVEARAGVILDELSHRGTVDVSIFSALLPGLIWNAGGHGSEELIRVFDNGHPVQTDAVRRAGLWLGAERQGEWFASALLRGGRVRDAAADLDAWTFGPFVRVTRPLDPRVIVGVAPILEAETRTGELRYGRAHGSIGITGIFGSVQVAAFTDVAVSTADTPRDVMPAATRDLAPWLPAGALRARQRATLGADAAVGILLDGYLRARFRALATAADIRDLEDSGRWRRGAELGLVWPTFVGPLEIGYAAGSGGDRVNISIGGAFH